MPVQGTAPAVQGEPREGAPGLLVAWSELAMADRLQPVQHALVSVLLLDPLAEGWTLTRPPTVPGGRPLVPMRLPYPVSRFTRTMSPRPR